VVCARADRCGQSEVVDRGAATARAVACQHVAALRVAALYDIHANVPALEAALAEVGLVGVDRIVIGGDVVPGPLPVETSSDYRRSATGPCFVRGNGDRWVVDTFETPGSMSEGDERPGRPCAAWTADAIDRRDRDLLASFGRDAAGWPLCVEAPVRLERPRRRYFDHKTASSGTDV
jgi:hypothetical protein